VLRRARRDDAAACGTAVLENLAHLAAFLSWATPEAADLVAQQERLERAEAAWDAGTEYQFLIVRPPDDTTVLGAIGMMDRLAPRSFELGYWLAASCERRGYVRTAARALTERGLALPDVDTMYVACLPENVRSAAVPLALGYHDDGLFTHPADASTCRIFSLTRGS
jgi:RimJ/RimL family protein N-acetyltransferase